MSAEERRESVVRAAVTEFARTGYHGTSTEAIARRVGVSQPYLFRLFPGKQALFRAAAERCFDRTVAAFEQSVRGASGEEALQAIGEAYSQLIRDREVLMLQMQLYVAAASAEDPELADFIRRRWREMWDLVRSHTGPPTRSCGTSSAPACSSTPWWPSASPPTTAAGPGSTRSARPPPPSRPPSPSRTARATARTARGPGRTPRKISDR